MKRYFTVLLLLLFLLLTGCSLFQPGELYCLPEAPEDYYDLQEALRSVLDEGYSYHAPASGTHRETVQLVDLNGDGTDEAVAFFRRNQDGAVKCYIFSKQQDVYRTSAVIDCTGTGVASVEYADLDGSGNLELLLSCQVSQTVPQALQVCRYDGNAAESLMTIPCSRYLLSSLGPWLMCFTDNGTEPCTLGGYRFVDNMLTLEGEEVLSGSYSQILDVQEIQLEDNTAALAVTSDLEDGRRSYDLLALTEAGVTRIQNEVLRSEDVRGDDLYPQDIDQDGKTELPQTQAMASYDEGSAAQSLVLWYGLSADGTAAQKAVTYYDFRGAWYLRLPDSWLGNILVKQSDTAEADCSVSQAIFYRLDDSGKAGEPLLTVYTLKGSGQQEYAEQQGLSVLYSSTDVLYAVSINEEAPLWEGTVTMNQVSDGFHPLEQ